MRVPYDRADPAHGDQPRARRGAGAQRARQIAGLLGFDVQDQTRIATAVSEIARNAFQYAGGGRIEFLADRELAPAVRIRIHDHGPGINDLDAILDRKHSSFPGMSVGIVGVRRLMDAFRIDSIPGLGTTVEMAKKMPKTRGVAQLRAPRADRRRPRPPRSAKSARRASATRTKRCSAPWKSCASARPSWPGPTSSFMTASGR